MTDRLPRHEGAARAADRLKSLPLYVLPHHAISRLVHRLTRVQAGWFRLPLIRLFIRVFRVDMTQAEASDPAAYPTFNAFFTRPLKPDARPLPDAADAVACPADGTVSALGEIDAGRLIQAKGHTFSAAELLGSEDLATPFQGGRFLTVYLSPRDYHRIHMPSAGRLRTMVHIPGRLFSVAGHTVRTIPRLFARNERVVSIFDSEHGPFAVVMVGAINVGSIETVWAGEVTPPAGRSIQHWDYHQDGDAPALARGAEMGRFNMGSTVIVLYGRDAAEWNATLHAGQTVRMGEAIGSLTD